MDLRERIRYDLPASFVVFLVALPLCIAIAVASNLPASAGLITGIIGGAVVGWIAGSPLQISGPAAGLIVLVAGVVNHFSQADVRASIGLPQSVDEGLTPANLFGVVLLLAAAFQLLAGLLRMAPWFRAVSPAVIQAMLAGIGMLILVGQFHVLLDIRPQASGLSNLLAIPSSLQHLANGTGGARWQAAALGALTIVVIVFWQAFLQKRLAIPGSLVAVVVGVALAYFANWRVDFVIAPADFVGSIGLPDWSAFAYIFDPRIAGYIWPTALGIAAIASAESLLSATAVDQLHRGVRTDFDRELVAQGVGNLLCAILGGLAMTGVIVRSSANINAGAKSRASAILHGLWLLLLVAFFPNILATIPMACLAGILVHTGFKLLDLNAVRALYRLSRGELIIFVATFAVIVGKDLLVGVIVGVLLSALKLLYTFTHLAIRVERDIPSKRTVLHLEGAATFVRLPQLVGVLEEIPTDFELHVDLTELVYIDHACLNLFANWAAQHESMGGKLILDWSSLHARFHGDDDGENGGRSKTKVPR